MIHQTLLLACIAPLATPAPTTTGDNAVVWEFENLETTLENAASADKPVLLYFWSNGSESCARLYGETMSKDAVIAEMSNYVCFSADTASTVGYELLQKYNMTTVPALVFVTPEGAVNDAVVGFIDAEGFVAELARVREGRDTIAAFRERAGAAPEDVEVQFAYAVKLQDCGDQSGYEAVTGRIKEADPKGSHAVAARLLMQDLQQSIVEAATQESGEFDFAESDLTVLSKFVGKMKHEKVVFDGWNWIAAVEKQRENNAAYRKATMAAWPHASDESVGAFGNEVAAEFWESREDLDRKEKKFVLTVASKAAESAEERMAMRQEELAAAGAEGCSSYEGCSDGEGCGGCGGAKAQMVAYYAGVNDALARALYVNGKRKDAIEKVQLAMNLAPENEMYSERLALFEARK